MSMTAEAEGLRRGTGGSREVGGTPPRVSCGASPPHTTMGDVHAVDDLPPELLEKIFVATLEHGGPRTRAPPSADLSQVCHRWREIALACSRLWSSDLPYRSPDWTELCLSRCTSTVLDINVVHDTTTRFDHGYHAAVALVLSRLDRTRSLRLQMKHGPIMPNDAAIITSAFLRAFKETKKRPCHGLAELSLDFGGRAPAPLLLRTMVPLIVDLFAGFAPISNLETITLAGCTYNRRGNLSSKLTGSHLRQLTLVDSVIWDSIDTAIAALQNTPKLEVLYVQTSEPHFEPYPSLSHETRCIKLPNLDIAVLRGLWQENIALFSYLAIPPRARLDIGSENYMDSDSDPFDATALSVVADAIRQHFAAALSQDVHYKEVEISGGHDFITITVTPEFGVANSDSHTLCPVDTLPDALELSMPWIEGADTQEALLQIFSTLPIFSTAETINLDPFIWQHYPEIYEPYTKVRVLKVEHVETYLAGYDVKRAALFPALTHILFFGAAFRTELLYSLVDHLMVAHSSLKTVEFCLCQFTGEAIAADAPTVTKQRLGERGISTLYTHVE